MRFLRLVDSVEGWEKEKLDKACDWKSTSRRHCVSPQTRSADATHLQPGYLLNICEMHTRIYLVALLRSDSGSLSALHNKE
jgi:hypothetical protein